MLCILCGGKAEESKSFPGAYFCAQKEGPCGVWSLTLPFHGSFPNAHFVMTTFDGKVAKPVMEIFCTGIDRVYRKFYFISGNEVSEEEFYRERVVVA